MTVAVPSLRPSRPDRAASSSATCGRSLSRGCWTSPNTGTRAPFPEAPSEPQPRRHHDRGDRSCGRATLAGRATRCGCVVSATFPNRCTSAPFCGAGDASGSLRVPPHGGSLEPATTGASRAEVGHAEQQELASTAARTGVGWGSGGLPGSVRWRRVGRRRRGGEEAAGGSMVFGASQDPVIIDGALISDGESSRVIDQVFEGLVKTEEGGTEIVPSLAESWEASPDGLGGRSIFATASRSTMASRSTPRPSASTSSAGTTSPASCRAPRCPTTGAR